MLILASQSPRRAELLRQAGIEFSIRPTAVDETPLEGEKPLQYVERLAREKADAAAAGAAPEDIVLGADTTVVIGHEMLGKPAGEADARRMLSALAGRRHEVITGICLRRGEEHICDSAVTDVWFSALTPEEIAEYAATGEPLDKAGGYAIQGLAARYIDKINGCYFNVVGLPLAMVYAHLRYLTNKTELPRSL